MTTCEDCSLASARDWYGFRDSCPGCVARMISRGPWFDDSRRLGRQTGDYRKALERTGMTHQQVRAAYAADFVNQGKQ